MSEARMMVRTKGWWREGGWIKGNGAGLWQCTQGLEAKRLIPREALHPVLIRRQFYERFERYPLCERERQREGGGGERRMGGGRMGRGASTPRRGLYGKYRPVWRATYPTYCFYTARRAARDYTWQPLCFFCRFFFPSFLPSFVSSSIVKGETFFFFFLLFFIFIRNFIIIIIVLFIFFFILF